MPGPVEIRLDGIEEALAHAPLNRRLLRRAQVGAMRSTAFWMRGQLQRRIPVRSGQTRGRIESKVEQRGEEVHGIVGGKSLAPGGFNILRGLEEGTGIYGPRRTPIRPHTAKVLRFTVGAAPVAGTGGNVVFARSVRGMEPRRPFARTKEEEQDAARRLFVKHLRMQIARNR